jgi:hypothetical protein
MAARSANIRTLAVAAITTIPACPVIGTLTGRLLLTKGMTERPFGVLMEAPAAMNAATVIGAMNLSTTPEIIARTVWGAESHI